MPQRFRRFVAPAIGLVLFGAALAILHRELAAHPYHRLVAEIRSLPGSRFGLALLAAAGSYLTLTFNDLLGLRFAGRRLGYPRTALASFVASAFSHNLSAGGLGGAAVRFRMYGAWGLEGQEIGSVLGFCGLTAWLGFLTVCGAALAIHPPELPGGFGSALSPHLRVVGVVMILPVAGYLVAAFARLPPIRIRKLEIPLPSRGIAVTQVVVSSIDWSFTALSLYVLLDPLVPMSFPAFLALFLSAQVLGLVSQVPGGLGVFETALVALLPAGAPTAVLAALVAFRVAYYLVPLAIAAVVLGIYEATTRREAIFGWTRRAGPWMASIVPHVMALLVLLSGIVLLVSGATPGVPRRLALLGRLLPEPLLELSHLAGSIAGAALLILARGLQRRLDAAFALASALLAVGAVASLLKGWDYEEAILLTLILFALLASRKRFYRRARLIHEAFSVRWLAAVAAILAGTFWLGLIAHRHVEYRAELWWHFALHADAPRFLRASVASVVVVVLFAAVRLLRPAPPEPEAPTDADIERLARILGRSSSTLATLGFLGDKSLMFSASGEAVLLYAVQGRSWIALGDPIGPEKDCAELGWEFRNASDRHAGWAVFYQVGHDMLPLYLDLGLTLSKLGEEARIQLEGFSLEGGARKGLRHTVRKLESEGCSFEVVGREAVEPILPELRRISNSWLDGKNVREKRFSVGFFHEGYLRRFPIALVRLQGRIVAFANVLRSGDLHELSVDLMRFEPDAPGGVMEYLLIRLMLHGAAEGYAEFNLGMAPLSGLENRALAPLWNRLGAMVYRHGEHFYNFQGLRRFKEKFEPEWVPRYLASPGGIALPAVLTSVATLVAGGVSGIVRR